MQNQVFCRFCGQTMPADSQFCPHCGKSQSMPATAATPPMEEAPAERGQLSSLPSNIGEKKGSLLPIILAAIAGIFVLCCVGLLLFQVFMRDKLSSAASEVAATPTTSAILQQQTDLSKKWTPAFLVLYAVEQHYADTIAKFERVAAGTLSRETYQNQFAVPDAYEVLFMAYFRAEEVDIEMIKEETAIEYAEIRPLVLSLEDDFETITLTELNWMTEQIDEAEALSRLREGQRALTAEHDKMYQAAKMDGMTDEVYAAIQSYLEKQWPTIKAKFDAIAIRMMTPQP